MTCGYVCPVCEGSGVLESGEPCDYCQKPKSPNKAAYPILGFAAFCLFLAGLF